MDRDGQLVIAYLGEDRQIYLNDPGKSLFKFKARVLHFGADKIIHITEIPAKFDGGAVKPPPGYKIQGV